MNTETRNMTSGNSLKQITMFFLPLLFGNLFQQIYSLVDSMIVGKGIGAKALAAVGATGTLNFLVLGFVVGLTRGFGILFSQSFGKGDTGLLRRYVFNSQILCMAVSVFFTVLCIALLDKMLRFMSTPEDIFNDAYSYFFVILAGIIVTVMNNLAITILQSLGDSKTPLIAMIVSSVVNIILDVLFVFGLRFGVIGAAAATVIAQVVSFFYCRIKAQKISFLSHDINVDAHGDGKLEIDKKLILELLKMGLPVGFMNSVTAAGAMLLQYFVNLMGSAYVAAYSVCMKFAALFEQFGISVGLAILTFVGQNKGAGQYDRIRKGVREGLLLSTIANIPFALIQIFIPGILAGVMVDDARIIGYCSDFMPVMGICIFGLGWLFIYRYAVQGLGNTFIPMLSGFLEVIMRLIFGFALGRASFTGIAISEVSAWLGAYVMLMITYYVLISQKHIE